MSPKKVSYLMVAVVVVLSSALVAATVAGDLLFKEQSEKLSSSKAENQAIKEQEISLAQAKADIEKYNELDTIARAIVPQDKDQAKTIREIHAIASETGVSIQQINFDVSSLGLTSSTQSGSTPGVTQVKPVPGINGVYSLELTASSGDSSPVSYYQFLQFLEKLEANRRTAHVTNIVVTPSEKNRDEVTFALTLNAYLKP
ncbi:MAG TPA: hypothetical protein VFX86_02230 [Candidatus Saccharimonadales bacterium]|nr:hypothetical protein [Candidatus Saccharimonadales bacterium]